MGASVLFQTTPPMTAEIQSISFSEDATPLSGDDTSGSTGSISFDLVAPDYGVPLDPNTVPGILATLGPNILYGVKFTLYHDTYGVTEGTVQSIARSDSGGRYSVQALTNLNQVNAYNVSAQPMAATLGAVCEYYCSLAGVPSGSVIVHTAIASRPVVYPGWTGRLWFHLKQMCIAEDIQINFSNGKIVFSPVSLSTLDQDNVTDRGAEAEITSLAQNVEIYNWKTRTISAQNVYPIGGYQVDNPPEVLNVDAGGTSEYVLQLSASVTSILPPVATDTIPGNAPTTSVYTVVADDGELVPAAMWNARGGKLTVTIEPDMRSLRVKLTGARGVPTTQGTEAKNFQIAAAADSSGSRYSTLRISGSGVAFDKELIRISTLVPASQTGTEVGATIDNPFIIDANRAYRVGTRTARKYAGPLPAQNGSFSNTNYPGGFGLPFTLGTLSGRRFWDALSRRWYRVRSGSVDPSSVSFNSENDLRYSDEELFFTNMTYGDVQSIRGGMTYQQVDLVGLYDPNR